MKTLFSPKSVALIGASSSPGKLGYDILKNLVGSRFSGNIFPVNPKAQEILGKKAYPSVLKIPDHIDLAVIAVPAPFVLPVVKECAEKKIPNIVIISAGFKETGNEGATEEQKIQEIVQKNNIHLVGPNCLGILNTHVDLNASFAEGMPKRGNIALVSQSGAMAVAITDWAYEQNIGFSKIVSLGNKAGISENDLLEYFVNDPETEVVMMYLESFVDGKKFMELAKRLAQKKPIIVLKSGTSDAGTKAVASHTGSLAGSDTAVETALRQCGVIRAHTIEDFFDLARTMSTQPLPKGNKIAIVTNAGGPGVIATDAISESSLLEMASFSSETSEKLKSSLPPTANIHNPIDVIGDALADRYSAALSAVAADTNVDMVLTLLTPQVMTQKEETARIVTDLHDGYPDTVMLTSFIGAKNTRYAAEELEEHGVPNFLYPTRAIKTMEEMVWLSQWREKVVSSQLSVVSRKKKIHISSLLLGGTEGSMQLNSKTSEKILNQYNIKMPAAHLATNEDEAVQYAEEIGYPVVLKISSADVIHKTDVGGVRLALKNEAEVRKGFQEIIANVQKKVPKAKVDGVLVQKMYHFGREVIVGMKRDPIFGPLVMFGLGGVYVEVMKDVSFRIAPFSTAEAEEMIHEIKAIQLLKGVRGEAASDIQSLAEVLVRVSELAMDYPEISELDLNPLLALPDGAVAVDTRIIVGETTA